MKRAILITSSAALAVLLSAALYTFLVRNQQDRKSVVRTEPMTFRIHAPDAKAVFVTGSFNSWRSVEFLLEKKEGGMWETTIPIAPGRYEYKFIVDTLWVHDVTNPIKVPVPLPYTGYNSVLDVRAGKGDSLNGQ